MNIKFKNINIENFLSIGEASIDFSNNGYTLVKGINNNKDDLATSNGSGKSSLFEAICWCLTGETIRGIKSDISNINTDGGAYVELNLEVSGDVWKIIRTKDHKQYKTNLKLFKNGLDISGKGIRDTAKILSDNLPDLTSSLIGSVIILGQGLPQRFSNNTPSGRKDVLEKLSKSDFMIEDLKDRIAKRKLYLSKELRKYEDAVLENESKLSVLLNKLDKDREQLDNIKDKESLEDILNNLINSQEKMTIDSRDIEEKLNITVENVQQLRLKYSDLSKKKSEITLKISNEKLQKVSEEDSLKSSLLGNLAEDAAYLKSKIESLESEIEKINSIKDICPTCGQKLVGVKKPSTESLRKDLQDNKESYNNILNKISEINKNYENKLNDLEKFFNRKLDDLTFRLKEDLNSTVSEGNRLKDESLALKSQLDSIKEDIKRNTDEVNRIKLEINTIDVTRNSLIQDINSLENEKIDIDNKIMYNTKRKELFESKLDIINKFNIFISRDFRGYLLNSVIDFINKRAKDYSNYIFNTDKIDFSLDGNNINISYCGKQYENLSGGERQKVDLIIQFSIRDMLCKFLNFSCNILIVDEIFDNLDSIGCQKIVNLISTKLQDINNIYVVTHRGDLEIPYDTEITVEKDEKGISRIV
jgi:DNA repair exonuclease SbcCD ATPase subunit